MEPKYINYIVTISNIFGFVPIYKVISTEQDDYFYFKLFSLFSMIIASSLMHISETKHELPGALFVKHNNTLLWIDRILAYLFGLFVAHKLYTHNELLTCNFLILGSCGLILNALSEIVFTKKDHQVHFMICHSLWHYFAYYVLSIII